MQQNRKEQHELMSDMFAQQSILLCHSLLLFFHTTVALDFHSSSSITQIYIYASHYFLIICLSVLFSLFLFSSLFM